MNKNLPKVIGLGLPIAATGVGASDLAGINSDKRLKLHGNKLSTNILLVIIVGLFVWLAFM